ncbi:hypothetical protein ACIRP2_24255 [Streptomyces sp. NPDC101194]|uniref:hypothetical protein n=1 Tax=Streptomyces sp. NPDC101194 TaxID=3366127 RepID=UPI0037F1B7C9
MGSRWNRDNSREYDIVVPAASGKRAPLLGSVKWRETKRFSDRELSHLAEARFAVPGASAAPLLAVCPAGVEGGVRPDLTLTPADLLAAWRRQAATDRPPCTPDQPSRDARGVRASRPPAASPDDMQL